MFVQVAVAHYGLVAVERYVFPGVHVVVVEDNARHSQARIAHHVIVVAAGPVAPIAVVPCGAPAEIDAVCVLRYLPEVIVVGRVAVTHGVERMVDDAGGLGAVDGLGYHIDGFIAGSCILTHRRVGREIAERNSAVHGSFVEVVFEIVEHVAARTDAETVECRAHRAGILSEYCQSAALRGHGAKHVFAGGCTVPAVAPHEAAPVVVLKVDYECRTVGAGRVAGPVLDLLPVDPIGGIGM